MSERGILFDPWFNLDTHRLPKPKPIRYGEEADMSDELLTPEEMQQAIIDDPNIPMGQAIAQAQLIKASKHYIPLMEKEYNKGVGDGKILERERIIEWLEKYQTLRRHSSRPFAEFRPPESEWQALKGEK